jgi:hypothetical protein
MLANNVGLSIYFRNIFIKPIEASQIFVQFAVATEAERHRSAYLGESRSCGAIRD